MSCNKRFWQMFRNVKKQYPKYSKGRQMKITWGIFKKRK